MGGQQMMQQPMYDQYGQPMMQGQQMFDQYGQPMYDQYGQPMMQQMMQQPTYDVYQNSTQNSTQGGDAGGQAWEIQFRGTNEEMRKYHKCVSLQWILKMPYTWSHHIKVCLLFYMCLNSRDLLNYLVEVE